MNKAKGFLTSDSGFGMLFCSIVGTIKVGDTIQIRTNTINPKILYTGEVDSLIVSSKNVDEITIDTPEKFISIFPVIVIKNFTNLEPDSIIEVI